MSLAIDLNRPYAQLLIDFLGFGFDGELYPTEDPSWFSRIAFISAVKTDPLVRYALLQQRGLPGGFGKHLVHRLENCGIFIAALADLVMRIATTFFLGFCCAITFGSVTWINETLRDHSHILGLAPLVMLKSGLGVFSLRAEEELFVGIRQSYLEEIATPYWKIKMNFTTPFT